MKDNQIAAKCGEPRILLVSPVLHCVSMTALVYLRSSFGFGYLRPKSVFFALSWAFILYSVYAWMDGEAWRAQRSFLIFNLGAVVLYWFHLSVAFYREWHQTGSHEHHSGTSHPLRFGRRNEGAFPEHFEETLHLWLEPGVVLLLSAVLRLSIGANALSAWLLLIAGCLWTKETLNRWFAIRQHKRRRDMFEDTAETIEVPTSGSLAHEPPKATRKARVKRGRSADPATEFALQERYAKLLCLLPPYDLADAELSYHALIKVTHPDTNGSSKESIIRTTELNEAVEFFRAHKSS